MLGTGVAEAVIHWKALVQRFRSLPQAVNQVGMAALRSLQNDPATLWAASMWSGWNMLLKQESVVQVDGTVEVVASVMGVDVDGGGVIVELVLELVDELVVELVLELVVELVDVVELVELEVVLVLLVVVLELLVVEVELLLDDVVVLELVVTGRVVGIMYGLVQIVLSHVLV